MENKRIKYCKSGWRKYSNRFFPKYEKQSWVVWEDDEHGVVFFNFEHAYIYAILLDIKLGELNKK